MAVDTTSSLQVQTISASRKRKSHVDLTPPMAKKRASSRNLRASSRTSQTLHAQPVPDVTSGSSSKVKDAQSTSPSTESLSQTSTASHNANSPSTTASSVVLDEGPTWLSPTKDGSVSMPQDSQKMHQTLFEHGRIRSHSVSSIDDTTRSSARARKPTTKARALADEGTKFYRSLRETPDSVDDRTALGQNAVTNDMTAEPEALSTIPPVIIEPEESIVASVEAAPVRTSPRQRKPTSKVASADTDRVTRKRKSSPIHADRVNKSARISSAIPDKPSKLRHPILSAEEEHEAADTQAEPNISVTGQPGNSLSMEAVETGTPCALQDCMNEPGRLLAFAEFAAEDLSDEDSDDDFETLLAAAQYTDGPRSVAERVFKAHCLCGSPALTKKVRSQMQDIVSTEETTARPNNDRSHRRNTENLAMSTGYPKAATGRFPGLRGVGANLAIPTQGSAGLVVKDKSLYDDNTIAVSASGVSTEDLEQKNHPGPQNNLRKSYENDRGWFITTCDNSNKAAETKSNDRIITRQAGSLSGRQQNITNNSASAHAEPKDKPSEQEYDQPRRPVNMSDSKSTRTSAKPHGITRKQGTHSTKPAGKPNLNTRGSNTRKDQKVAVQVGKAEMENESAVSGSSSLIAGMGVTRDITPVQVGIEAGATAVGARVGEYKSEARLRLEHRLKVLEARAAFNASQEDKRDSTGTSRTRGHQNVSPLEHVSSSGVPPKGLNMMEQEPRPSKKIILRFRKP